MIHSSREAIPRKKKKGEKARAVYQTGSVTNLLVLSANIHINSASPIPPIFITSACLASETYTDTDYPHTYIYLRVSESLCR